MPDSREEIEEQGTEIEERQATAFEEWADEHPHLANLLCGFTTGAITSVAVALAGEPEDVIVLAIAAVTLTVFLFCELVTRFLGRSLLGSGQYLYTGDDPRTAAWAETFFGGGDGGGGDGGGGGS
jgi:hypothetical protein